MGARQSNANYQFTLKGDDIAELKSWTTKLADAMQLQPQLTDISTDQEDRGVEMFVTIDHDAAARHGISSRDIHNALYNAFGQRTASTIYEKLNQYSVILGVAPRYAQSRDRKSVVSGKSVAVRVSLGGRRPIQKK